VPGLDMPSIIQSILLLSIVTSAFFFMWRETRKKYLLYWTAALFNNTIILFITFSRVAFPHLDLIWRISTDALAAIGAIHTAMGALYIAGKTNVTFRNLAVLPIAATLWSVLGNLGLENPVLASMPVFLAVGAALVGAGWVLIRDKAVSVFRGSRLAGTCLIVWGILDTTYPLAHDIQVVSPLGHYLACALALMTSLMLLMVSLEEVRHESDSERERLRVTLNSIGDAVIAVDRDAKVTVLNPVAESLTGWTAAEALGCPLAHVFKVFNEETRQPAPNLVDRVLADGSTIGLANHTSLISRDGTERSIADSAAPIHDRDGTVSGVILVFRDVTEERRRQRRLEESEERFRSIAEHTSDVLFRLRLLPEPEFEYLSPAVVSVTGYTAEEMCADFGLARSCIHPDDAGLIRLFAKGEDLDRPTVLRWKHRDGRTVWTEQRFAPVYDDEGNLSALHGIARDVTEQKRMEAQVRYMSLHDPLTGLYNRAYFEEEMKRLDDPSRFTERPITILSTDVDGMKLVNDTKGHKEGDDLLKAYAGVLRTTFAGQGICARVGGDEFAVILRGTDLGDGIEAMRALEEAIADYNAGNPSTTLSVSIGAATSDGAETLEDVHSRADRSLFNAQLHASPTGKSGLVKSLLAALMAKDFVSEGHIARVTEVALRIGNALSLTRKELLDLELLAEVHDLGKVGIPDRILFKPGPLDAEERAQMQEHTAIGYRIAKSSLELTHIAGLILHHHEWWNGEGYPSGLKGEAIPVACRIIAIADAYDAIRSPRPYKPPRTHEEAMAELKRCAGTQFDPRLVEIFASVADDLDAGTVMWEAATTSSL
jgi:diguanylate cyclase (GGDEF)-like protein/PAS domain S-box-containing protein